MNRLCKNISGFTKSWCNSFLVYFDSPDSKRIKFDSILICVSGKMFSFSITIVPYTRLSLS